MDLLSQVCFSILFALSLQPRHGYGIMQQVERDSAGRINLGPGALYVSIKQLREAGLIEELPEIEAADRRRYYKLSRSGWERLNNEINYYKTTVNLARKRMVTD